MNPQQRLNSLKLQKNLSGLKARGNGLQNPISQIEQIATPSLTGVEFKSQFHKEKKQLFHLGFYQSAFVLFAIFLFLSGALVYGIKTNQKQASANIKLKNVTEKTGGEDIDAVFGGGKSLAAKSRLNRETTIQKDWLRRNFVVREGSLDKDFNCLQKSVCGDFADADNDGAANLTEYNFGTDPNNRDTDNDGISDGDELYGYFTNPRSADSDGDEEKDLIELVACTDPTVGVKNLIFTNDRLNQIATNVISKPLTEPTITSFRMNGATIGDIQTFGYFKQKCDLIKEEAQKMEEAENLEETNGGENTQETGEQASSVTENVEAAAETAPTPAPVEEVAPPASVQATAPTLEETYEELGVQ